MEAAKQQLPLRGFRTDVLDEIRVTVSLVEKRREGYEGWAFAVQSVVVIALDDVALWDDDKLRRVIRHEVSHVGMARVLGGRVAPIWFSEGFAEWAAGGPDCAGQVRLGLNVLTRYAGGRALGHLDNPDRVSRNAYDLYASFFSFIEDRYPGPLEEGALLVAVREEGVRDGIENTFGKTVEELEREWQQHLFSVFVDGGIPNCTVRSDLTPFESLDHLDGRPEPTSAATGSTADRAGRAPQPRRPPPRTSGASAGNAATSPPAAPLQPPPSATPRPHLARHRNPVPLRHVQLHSLLSRTRLFGHSLNMSRKRIFLLC